MRTTTKMHRELESQMLGAWLSHSLFSLKSKAIHPPLMILPLVSVREPRLLEDSG